MDLIFNAQIVNELFARGCRPSLRSRETIEPEDSRETYLDGNLEGTRPHERPRVIDGKKMGMREIFGKKQIKEVGVTAEASW